MFALLDTLSNLSLAYLFQGAYLLGLIMGESRLPQGSLLDWPVP